MTSSGKDCEVLETHLVDPFEVSDLSPDKKDLPQNEGEEELVSMDLWWPLVVKRFERIFPGPVSHPWPTLLPSEQDGPAATSTDTIEELSEPFHGSQGI